jgi:small-conductance mechanosensitive channel
MLRCTIILPLLFAVLSPGVLAQSTSSADDTARADAASYLIMKIDSMRIADSANRALLLKEIEAMKGAARHQRTSLLGRLQVIQRADSAHQARLKLELAELSEGPAGVPVVPFADTLFQIHTRMGSFTAADRARAVESRIRALYHDLMFAPDSLRTAVNETSTDIVFRGRIIMTVNELEALWYGVSHQELALSHRDLISDEITRHRVENSMRNWLMRMAAALGIVGAIIIFMFLVNRVSVKLRQLILNLGKADPTSPRVGKAMRGLVVLLPAVKWTLDILFIFFMLPLLLAEFPMTAGMAEVMRAWILEPVQLFYNEFIAYLPNLFVVLLIATATYLVTRFLGYLANEVEKGVITISGFYPEWARPTFSLVRVLLFAFSFVMIFPYLPGSESPIFRGVSVFLGLLFSIGSSSAISNAVAGLLLTYMRPFRVGDRIKVGEILGYVTERSLLVTRVKTIKNEDVTIPNSAMLTGPTTNYSSAAAAAGILVNTSVSIGYAVPWQKVNELLIEAARSTRHLVVEDERMPFVLQTRLDDFYVSYQINAFTHRAFELEKVYSDLHANIQSKFSEAGVEILSPHYRVLRGEGKLAG